MKFHPKTLTADHRAKIAEAIADLGKAIKRAERHSQRSAKLAADLEQLNEEHGALNGRALDRKAAIELNAIVSQRTSITQALERAEGEADADRQHIYQVITDHSMLLMRLLKLAETQFAVEVAEALQPFYSTPQDEQFAYMAAQTEYGLSLVRLFQLPTMMHLSMTINGALTQAGKVKALLEDIAADREFFTLKTEVAQAA